MNIIIANKTEVYKHLIILHTYVYIFSVYNLVQLQEGLIRAGTRSCKYVFFNKQLFCFTDIYLYLC